MWVDFKSGVTKISCDISQILFVCQIHSLSHSQIPVQSLEDFIP